MRCFKLALLALTLATPALAQSTGSVVLQQRPAGSGGITVDDIANYVAGRTNFNESAFDFVGDSRTENLYVSASVGSQAGLSGLNWFNAANALANNRYILGVNAGKSGCRTDQYLQDSNFAQILASSSLWVVFNFPAVNDLGAAGSGCSISPGGSGSFPYTNSNGVSVTQTTVGAIAAGNLIPRIQQVIAQGRNAIVLEEPGAVALTAASVGQQYDFNARMKAFCLATVRCYYLSLNQTVWNPTGSSTTDTFLTGTLIDNLTHYSILGAQLQGAAFNTWFQSMVPGNANLLLASINNNFSNNPRQLLQNPLFQTQTGGTNTICNLTGNVPANWTLICGVGTTAVTLTYVNDPTGFLNASCVNLAITSAGADTVRLQSNSQATSAWNLTDWFQSSAQVTVAASSSAARVYANTAIATVQGTRNAWALYGGDAASGGGANDGPTTAYTLTLVTPPAQAPAGSSTKSFVLGPVIYHQFSAAGNVTTTICRPSLNRIYSFNPANSSFSGQ